MSFCDLKTSDKKCLNSYGKTVGPIQTVFMYLCMNVCMYVCMYVPVEHRDVTSPQRDNLT